MGITVNQLAASSGLLHAAGLTTQSTGQGTQLPTADGTTSIFGMTSDGYFKLFLAELTNQDPTSPMDNKDMVAQMAQFTMIQTLQNLAAAMTGSQLSQASSLIGKHVTGTDVGGSAVDGTVDSVQRSGADLFLIVGKQVMKPDNVKTVEAPAPAATPPATGTGTTTGSGSGTGSGTGGSSGTTPAA